LQCIDLAAFPGVTASRVLWGAEMDGSARQLLAQAEQEDEDGAGENARKFLEHMLVTGPMRASDIFRAGEAHGYSKRQMQRARSAIGDRIEKIGMSQGWEWSLPRGSARREDAEDAEQSKVAPSAPSAGYRRIRG